MLLVLLLAALLQSADARQRRLDTAEVSLSLSNSLLTAFCYCPCSNSLPALLSCTLILYFLLAHLISSMLGFFCGP